jgi:hypothetical protein
MTEITFGRLEDLPLRDVWPDEARDFTPWLTENIDYVGDAIDIRLEVTLREARVGTFSADILARNTDDGTNVLIENQLVKSDHTHLGQIMTYLAGLEAQTVVWVAKSFQEPHLSAIRWLNEHTSDGFSFFAVRLRVVRISDSPYAPIFEVVEKPNNWDRDVKKASRERRDISIERDDYWQAYAEKFQDFKLSYGGRGRKYLEIEQWPGLKVCLGVFHDTCSIHLRADSCSSWEDFDEFFGNAIPQLVVKIGPRRTRMDGTAFGNTLREDLNNRASWDDMMNWQHDQLLTYVAALKEASEMTQ